MFSAHIALEKFENAKNKFETFETFVFKENLGREIT